MIEVNEGTDILELSYAAAGMASIQEESWMGSKLARSVRGHDALPRVWSETDSKACQCSWQAVLAGPCLPQGRGKKPASEGHTLA